VKEKLKILLVISLNTENGKRIRIKTDTTDKTPEVQPQQPKPVVSTPTPAKKKLSFKEQRELETIEKEMPELEKQRNIILDKLNNETDYEKISVLSADLEKVSEN
jgi:ATP-binding cassette subfamily F protein uup